MSDRLEELKKELVQEIQSLAKELSNSQSFVGLLSYESKFKLLHEKFINLKFLERKHIGLDVFDAPIPVEEEKQEVFSVSEERFEDEQVNEYFFEEKEMDERDQNSVESESHEVEETSQPDADFEDKTNDEVIKPTEPEPSPTPKAPHDSHTEGIPSEIDDFEDLLPKTKHYPKIQIDFNDRIAFLNQLFDGDSNQMESTIDTLNHMSSFSDSKSFIKDLSKENDWTDKDEYIERLMELVSKRFD